MFSTEPPTLVKDKAGKDVELRLRVQCKGIKLMLHMLNLLVMRINSLKNWDSKRFDIKAPKNLQIGPQLNLLNPRNPQLVMQNNRIDHQSLLCKLKFSFKSYVQKL